ncbi:MAG: efflux RND transporter periplasmic adaptor subunit, partial [Betaproteobacteria bacterium]|nr:efflux RND transporter periplasmic adaptor subunit [Betaproteobacteria bacterium]
QRRLATYAGGSGGIALKSPIEGRVVAVGAGAGSAVEDGQTLIHIADLGKLWLEARIPESELGRISQPSGAFFRLDGEPAARVLEVGRNARLVAFGGLVDKDSRTAPAIFEFNNPERRLRAGMNLRVGIYTGRTAVRAGVARGERVVILGAYQVRLAATAPAALGHGHAH